MRQYITALENVESIADSFKGNTTVAGFARQLKLEILRAWYKAEEMGPGLSDVEKDALQNKRDKILAIKLYRVRTNAGLKDAKDYIENKMVELGIGVRDGSNVRFTW
jgi:ribosomal protein L7/L12